MSTPWTPLIETRRGDTPECIHFGALAVCDTQGRVLAHAGDPGVVTFTRSTLKALQALPLLECGGARELGFTEENLAMLCASHSGEAMHVRQVEDMLGKAGMSYQRLQCGCHVPMYVDLGVGERPAQFDERHHNCSGKHSGFLAYCAVKNLPVDNYIDPVHPLQVAVREHVARAVGMDTQDLRMGIDGCSAPNYAMPLAKLARGYARLASGAADAEFGGSFEVLAQAMAAHGDLVSGTRRNDEAYMRVGAGDWVTKVGADGVQVVASRSRRQALALKIADGNAVALHAATVEALDQLGWLDDAQREALRPWRAATISSVRGAPVGERRAVFRLATGS